MSRPLVIAHRGDSAHRPENTLSAFLRALELGVSVVELDVQLTADREVVVLHDAAVDRTTNGGGDVRRMKLAELRALSAGYPTRFAARWAAERVPTLAEALELLKGRARVLVEIKTESVSAEHADGVEARTVEVVRRLGMEDEVALISFDHVALERLAGIAPAIARGHLFGRIGAEEAVRAAQAVGCRLVMPHKAQVNEALASRVLDASMDLATWVVDEPQELRRLARFPLYGVGSNCPGLLLQAIADGLLER